MVAADIQLTSTRRAVLSLSPGGRQSLRSCKSSVLRTVDLLTGPSDVLVYPAHDLAALGDS